VLRLAPVTLLVSLWAATPALSELWTSPHDQQSLISTALSLSNNYSVDFSLASSYGAAVVIIDDARGETKTFTWVVYGDPIY
jgi:hypothetical protein